MSNVDRHFLQKVTTPASHLDLPTYNHGSLAAVDSAEPDSVECVSAESDSVEADLAALDSAMAESKLAE